MSNSVRDVGAGAVMPSPIERLLDDFVSVLRARLVPVEVSAEFDYTTLAPALAPHVNDPEFRRTALAVAELVGRHLASQPNGCEQKPYLRAVRFQFSGVPATGTIRCRAAPAVALPIECYADELLERQIAPLHGAVLGRDHDGRLTVAFYPQALHAVASLSASRS